MKMIVGLGNPGSKYKETKHNVGFMTVDEIARREQLTFKHNKLFEAETAEFFCGSEKVMLVKPQTFMNESGRAVGPLMTYYQVELTDLLVIYDDLDLTLGKIRLREKGGAGGHNGIKSLISHLQTNVFPRVKIGIGRPPEKMSVVNHVLSPFAKSDQPELLLTVDKAADAALYFCEGHHFIDVMNRFN